MQIADNSPHRLVLLALLAVACDVSPPPGEDSGVERDGGVSLLDAQVDGGSCTAPGEPDADGDGVPDRCDVCAEGDDALDADEDGVPDACEPSGTFVPGPQFLDHDDWAGGQPVDVDGDGDLDIHGVRWTWTNDGTGIFSRATTLPGPFEERIESWVIGDVDGDSDADLVVTGSDMPCGVALNDGLGNYGPNTLIDDTFGCAASYVGDIDGDGVADIGLMVADRRVVYWRGDGSGGFAQVRGEYLGVLPSARTTIGDVDGDGDVDLVFAEGGVLLNDGSGAFTVAEGPSFSDPHRMQLVDVDGDGRPDVMAYVGRRPNYVVRVSRNLGDAGFAPAVDVDTEPAGYATHFDYDGDGDVDIAVPYFGGFRVWVNDGGGNFSRSIATEHPYEDYGLHGADFNGDGRMDIMGVSWLQRVWLQQPDGSFAMRRVSLPNREGRLEPLLDDVDGDGDLDVFVRGNGRSESRWWLNDGHARLTRADALIPDDRDSDAYALADLDGGGVREAVSIHEGRIYLHRRGADGAFSATDLGPAPHLAPLSHAGDVDGDGYEDVLFDSGRALDLLRGGPGGPIPGLLHVGESVSLNGGFTLIDHDGDGDLDILDWQRVDPQLFTNEGGSAFTGGQPLPFRPRADGLAAGDLDGDGVPDVIVYYEDEASVWIGDRGAPLFRPTEQSFGPGRIADVVLLDADGDADLDAFVVRAPIRWDAESRDQLWLNDGAGRFTESAQRFPSGSGRYAAAAGSHAVAGDFDGDGGMDLYVVNRFQDELWLNR